MELSNVAPCENFSWPRDQILYVYVIHVMLNVTLCKCYVMLSVMLNV